MICDEYQLLGRDVSDQKTLCMNGGNLVDLDSLATCSQRQPPFHLQELSVRDVISRCLLDGSHIVLNRDECCAKGHCFTQTAEMVCVVMGNDLMA